MFVVRTAIEPISNAHIQETYTADAVASFLLQNEIGVLVENGGKIITTRSARGAE
jgi:hypothetical protein